MSPVGQDVAGSNCGNIVLAAKHAGCLYAHLEETFMVQFCCGSGDCSKAGVGGTKRDVLDYPTLAARARNGELGDESFAATIVSFFNLAFENRARLNLCAPIRQ